MPPVRSRGGQDRDYNDPISRGGRGRGSRSDRRDDFRSGSSRGTSRSQRSADEDCIMRVAASSEMPSTAGAIAWRAREGRPIIIEAAGPSCLNIVAKALCICRSMLVDDRIDIKCTPEFYSPEDADDGSALNTVVRIYIETEKAKAPQTRTGSLVRATPNSDARKVAGALAVNVRRNEPCAVSAGGRISINVAVKSLAIARSYLEEDGLDITFQPCFPFAESSEVHFVVHRVGRGRN